MSRSESIAGSILRSVGILTFPNYWAGIPFQSPYIDSEKLEDMYRLIREKVGDFAARNFVKMIASITPLTMQGFVNIFCKLEEVEWRWDNSLLEMRQPLGTITMIEVKSILIEEMGGKINPEHVRKTNEKMHDVQIRDLDAVRDRFLKNHKDEM